MYNTSNSAVAPGTWRGIWEITKSGTHNNGVALKAKKRASDEKVEDADKLANATPIEEIIEMANTLAKAYSATNNKTGCEALAKDTETWIENGYEADENTPKVKKRTRVARIRAHLHACRKRERKNAERHRCPDRQTDPCGKRGRSIHRTVTRTKQKDRQ
ncbi:hypothetical protein TRVL_04710 [Trypanosoma vivax]|nr:hypothetical protein TRVL_04710 [Trypanosoma vivax]